MIGTVFLLFFFNEPIYKIWERRVNKILDLEYMNFCKGRATKKKITFNETRKKSEKNVATKLVGGGQ